MTKFDDLKTVLLQRPDVRAEYEALEEEFELAGALIRARANADLTQAEVAERMKTSQSYIAKLESGLVSPSMKALKRYADATGAKLKISLEQVAG
jgi:transcriptional regulator with XRE-family HTH domain